MPAEDVHAGRQRVLWELAETPSHPSVSVTSDSAAISLSLAFGKARSVGEPRDLVYRLPFKHSSRLREEQGQFQKKKTPHSVFPSVAVTFFSSVQHCCDMAGTSPLRRETCLVSRQSLRLSGLATAPLVRPQIIPSCRAGFLTRSHLFWNSGLISTCAAAL